MRSTIIGIVGIVALAVAWSGPAEARHYHSRFHHYYYRPHVIRHFYNRRVEHSYNRGSHRHYKHEAWSYREPRRGYGYHSHWRSGALDANCRRARSLGGPCGCFAAELIFGRNIRSLWLAAAWYRFPRTSPHSGAVAVRPHHVVEVVGVNHDGTVTVHDSWGVHRQSVRGWTFVEPSARFASRDWHRPAFAERQISRRHTQYWEPTIPSEEIRGVSWNIRSVR